MESANSFSLDSYTLRTLSRLCNSNGGIGITIETFIIPVNEGVLALDLVSASLNNDVDKGVALSNTDSHLRLKTVFAFAQITGRFSQMVLAASLAEGQRQMFMRQPIHVRVQSSKSSDESDLYHILEEE